MNPSRSDLGLCSSKLTYILCFKIPLEKCNGAVKLLKAQNEHSKMRLAHEIKKKRFLDEVCLKQRKYQMMEKKLQNVKLLVQVPKLSHCERHCKILISTAEHKVISIIMKRAKQNLRK
ncbi:hypothetical protein CEXT_55131 [Caerostris extrusa]|uniref:Uncharacterized protein n=1 Tax=Caerostris extrusa TaxID=172846 RepID=A0AAV4ML55_CAEEX|nr:hypothetical protein CEXT_55131 [Caerostris extrusa]